MSERTVTEQHAVTARDENEFARKLDSEFERGWRIVPGSVAMTMVPESSSYARQERYFAVVER